MSLPAPPTVPATAVPAQDGPCHAWTTIADTRARCNLLATVVDDAALQFGIDLATLILWAATGRRYGYCQRTVRPCWEGERSHGFTTSTSWPAPASYFHTPVPTVLGGVVDVYPAWPRITECSCRVPELVLPGPIGWVEEVMVDGVPLNLGNVRIRTAGHGARRTLLRVDEENWFCANDLARDPAVVPLTDEPTPAWHVTYWQGREIATGGVEAVQMLAEQIGRQYCQDANCDQNMVAGLTRVSRRGVVKEFDPKSVTDDNGQIRTGIDAADRWVDAVNPHGRHQSPKIVRPDDPERRRIWSWVNAA